MRHEVTGGSAAKPRRVEAKRLHADLLFACATIAGGVGGARTPGRGPDAKSSCMATGGGGVGAEVYAEPEACEHELLLTGDAERREIGRASCRERVSLVV